MYYTINSKKIKKKHLGEVIEMEKLLYITKKKHGKKKRDFEKFLKRKSKQAKLTMKLTEKYKTSIVGIIYLFGMLIQLIILGLLIGVPAFTYVSLK